VAWRISLLLPQPSARPAQKVPLVVYGPLPSKDRLLWLHNCYFELFCHNIIELVISLLVDDATTRRFIAARLQKDDNLLQYRSVVNMGLQHLSAAYLTSGEWHYQCDLHKGRLVTAVKQIGVAISSRFAFVVFGSNIVRGSWVRIFAVRPGKCWDSTSVRPRFFPIHRLSIILP
jgi:hypothetical protein